MACSISRSSAGKSIWGKSMLFKKLNFIQDCWVVPDRDQAMKRWIDLGVGPFFRRDADYQNAIYRSVTTLLSFRARLHRQDGFRSN